MEAGIIGRVAGILMLAGAAGLQAQTNALDPIEAAEGFVSLFDGTREGFNAHFVNYVQDNMGLTDLDERWTLDATEGAMATAGAASDLRSKVPYKDFDFRFDYRNDGDAGVFYRFTLSMQYPWQSGVELPIDPNASFCKNCAGGVLAMYEPNVPELHAFESGQWNTLRVVAIGDSVEHWVNGTLAVGYRYHSEDFMARYSASKWASMGNTMSMKVPGDVTAGYIDEGFVGFQGLAGGKWLLRNVRINPTAPKFGAATPTGILRAPKSAARADLRGSARGLFLLPVPGGKPVTADGRRALLPAR